MKFIHRILQLVSAFTVRSTVPHRQIGAALMRMAFGGVTTILYALHLNQRQFLWGKGGVVDWPDNLAIMHQTGSWTLYQFFPSAAGANCIYALGLIISLLFTLGLFGRITSILFFAFTWSLYQRNVYAMDGGENLLIILTFYLLFADLSALSLDRVLFRRKFESRTQRAGLGGMLHNFAVVACLTQLGILYFESAFYKIQGHVWSNGTALYYIMRTNAFSLTGWSDFIWRSAGLITILTYGTILFELVHPFLMWHRGWKYPMFAIAVFFHLGIAVFMGLPWFSLTMISAHAMLFRDGEYQVLARWLRRMRAKRPVFGKSRLLNRGWGVEPIPAGE